MSTPAKPTPTIVNNVLASAYGSRTPYFVERFFRPDSVTFNTSAGPVETEVDHFKFRQGDYYITVRLPQSVPSDSPRETIDAISIDGKGIEVSFAFFHARLAFTMVGRIGPKETLSWGAEGVKATFSIQDWELTSTSAPTAIYGTLPGQLERRSANMSVEMEREFNSGSTGRTFTSGHVMKIDDHSYYMLPDKDAEGQFTHLAVVPAVGTSLNIQKLKAHLSALSLSAGGRFYSTEFVGLSADLQVVSHYGLEAMPLQRRIYPFALPGTTIEYASALGSKIDHDPVVKHAVGRLIGSSTNKALDQLFGLRDAWGFLTYSDHQDTMNTEIGNVPAAEAELVTGVLDFLNQVYDPAAWKQMNITSSINTLSAMVAMRLGKAIGFAGPFGRRHATEPGWTIWTPSAFDGQADGERWFLQGKTQELSPFRWGNFLVPEIPSSGPIATISKWVRQLVNPTAGLVRAKLYASPRVSDREPARFSVRVFPSSSIASKSTIAVITTIDGSGPGPWYSARSPYLNQEYDIFDVRSAEKFMSDLGASETFRSFIGQLMELSQELREDD